MLYAGNPEELEGWNCKCGDLETSGCSFSIEDARAGYSLETECTPEHRTRSHLCLEETVSKELNKPFKTVLPNLGDQNLMTKAPKIMR